MSGIKRPGLIKSFNHAINGFIYVFKAEWNMQLHILIAVTILLFSLLLDLSRLEMVAITFAIGLVLVAEMVNTSLEGMLDFVHGEEHAQVGMFKDIAAGAVLVASIVAVIVGYLILYPHLGDFPLNPLISRLREAPEYVSFVILLLVVISTVAVKAYFGKGTPLRGGALSGHAALSFACWVVITFLAKDILVSLLVLMMAIVISHSRARTGIHTYFEVIVGALLGSLLAFIVFQIVS
ncbi:TPA: diacylglycerol kinase [bacterium]|nr:diacylglycerol kinase [bacterium]